MRQSTAQARSQDQKTSSKAMKKVNQVITAIPLMMMRRHELHATFLSVTMDGITPESATGVVTPTITFVPTNLSGRIALTAAGLAACVHIVLGWFRGLCRPRHRVLCRPRKPPTLRSHLAKHASHVAKSLSPMSCGTIQHASVVWKSDRSSKCRSSKRKRRRRPVETPPLRSNLLASHVAKTLCTFGCIQLLARSKSLFASIV